MSDGQPASQGRILVVDDEANVLSSLKMALTVEGYEVDVAGGVGLARERARKHNYDAALLDVGLPDGNGLDLLKALRQEDERILCIMMSGQASIEVAVEATQAGAIDFLEKPVATERLLLSLRNSLRLQNAETRARELLEESGETVELRGSSRAMAELCELVGRAARSSANVMITGERGTGKELVARAIHASSPRHLRPLEKINCAAVPENLIESELFGHEAGAFTGATKRRKGKFERASGGTLFLDEVGDMPLTMQAKLLRVLQEGEVERVGGSETLGVDVRVVAATNKDLAEECAEGRFRADLLDRLNVVPIELPPLRERVGDVRELALEFLHWAAKRNDRPGCELTSDALDALDQMSFPGNVRELRNLIERLVILSPRARIDAAAVIKLGGQADVAARGLYRPGVSFRELVEDAERAILTEALRASGGQMAATARALGLERSHLYKKAKALGLREG